ncbi:MAG: hypothetical protein PHD05_00915 [Sphaerochaetaceae bacterium]|nr:hypothetical protein [Sphaerochaetaceae bacterium]
MDLFSKNLDEMLDSISGSMGKVDRRTYWPATGSQLTGSYIELEALDIFNTLLPLDVLIINPFKLFKFPSKIRCLLAGTYLVGLKILIKEGKINREDAFLTIEKLFFLLAKMCKSDIFALNGSNLILSNGDAELLSAKVQNVDSVIAKTVSRLIVSLDSLILSLYYDIFTNAGVDYHGPYKLADGDVLLVREYFDIKPIELWPSVSELPYARVRVSLRYAPIEIKLDYLMHQTADKPLLSNLKGVLVEVFDGQGNIQELSPQKMIELTTCLLGFIQKQTALINSLSILEKVKKGAEISHYQLKEFKEYFGESWLPSEEILNQINLRAIQVWEKYSIKSVESDKIPIDKPVSPINWARIYDPRISDLR